MTSMRLESPALGMAWNQHLEWPSQGHESSCSWQHGRRLPDSPDEPKPQNEHMLHGGGHGDRWCGHTGRCASTGQGEVCGKGGF